jgi:peroxiredoxin (alkyl hydroperoxide reductase subunit C)
MSTLLGLEAPPFSASVVDPDGSIRDEVSLDSLKGKYTVLFFYPYDFSFVCPTELLALDERLDAFRDRGCQVIGVSVDSVYTHRAWRNTPVEEGGIGPVGYPLLSDLGGRITSEYGVMAEDGAAQRATFLLDGDGVVRHLSVNDMDVGRNVDEILRTLDALAFTEKSGKACPANWMSDQPAGGGARPAKKGRGSGPPAGVKRNILDFDLGS